MTGDASPPETGAWRSDGMRVPRLAGARACVWTGIAVAIGVFVWPAPEPEGWRVVQRAQGCGLVAGGEEGPACPCAELPARLRVVLGLSLSLNRASVADLETLPGVGPRRAAAIVAERSRRGGFATVTDLDDVTGLGRKTVARLEPRLFVGADPACPADFGLIRSGARPPD